MQVRSRGSEVAVGRKVAVGPISPGTRTRMRHWGTLSPIALPVAVAVECFGVQEQSLECRSDQRTMEMHNGLFWMLDCKMPKAGAIHHKKKSQSFVILTI